MKTKKKSIKKKYRKTNSFSVSQTPNNLRRRFEITKKMTFTKVLEKYPETAEIFMNEGMYCLGCSASSYETIGQGCLAHGLDVNKIIEKLNKKIQKLK